MPSTEAEEGAAIDEMKQDIRAGYLERLRELNALAAACPVTREGMAKKEAYLKSAAKFGELLQGLF